MRALRVKSIFRAKNFYRAKYGGQQRINTVCRVGLGWAYYLVCLSIIYEIFLIIRQLRQPSMIIKLFHIQLPDSGGNMRFRSHPAKKFFIVTDKVKRRLRSIIYLPQYPSGDFQLSNPWHVCPSTCFSRTNC